MNRRLLIKTLLLSPLVSFFSLANNITQKKPILKKIPSSGDSIPSIGMGTWLTFDIGYNTKELKVRAKILDSFFKNGGHLIDSSPMYGTSERVLGKAFSLISSSESLFSATKIWTPNKWHGQKQVENSKKYWKLKKFNLLQVHNLVNYEEHLETLYEYKNKALVNYIGVTTSHGSRHKKLETIMNKYKLDFVQLTYNIVDREAENYLLPLAKERNIAVIANRPFQGGQLFNYVKNRKLPSTAFDLGIKSWADYFLKFIISHPSVTCAIPATSRIDHMEENMQALYGILPNKKERGNLIKEFIEL